MSTKNGGPTSEEEKAGILPAPEGAYEREIAQDSEHVMIRTRPSRLWAMIELVVLVALGLGIGFYATALVREHFFKYSYLSHQTLLLAVTLAPGGLGLLVGSRRQQRRLFYRYELSRRFIRSEAYAGLSVENCDMSAVKDCCLRRLGPVSTVIIYTSDMTTPVLRLEFLPTEEAEKVFRFVNSHAKRTLTEHVTSLRSPPRR